MKQNVELQSTLEEATKANTISLTSELDGVR